MQSLYQQNNVDSLKDYNVNAIRNVAFNNYRILQHIKMHHRLSVDPRIHVTISNRTNGFNLEQGFKLFIDNAWDQNSPHKMNDT